MLLLNASCKLKCSWSCIRPGGNQLAGYPTGWTGTNAAGGNNVGDDICADLGTNNGATGNFGTETIDVNCADSALADLAEEESVNNCKPPTGGILGARGGNLGAGMSARASCQGCAAEANAATLRATLSTDNCYIKWRC